MAACNTSIQYYEERLYEAIDNFSEWVDTLKGSEPKKQDLHRSIVLGHVILGCYVPLLGYPPHISGTFIQGRKDTDLAVAHLEAVYNTLYSQ